MPHGHVNQILPRLLRRETQAVPPDHIHWYKNVEAPFRYLEVQTP